LELHNRVVQRNSRTQRGRCPIDAIAADHDGCRFKAVNNRDRNYTSAEVQKRMEHIEASINRYLAALDAADQADAATAPGRQGKLKEKIAALKKRMGQLKEIEVLVQATPDKQISLADPDARSMATSGRGTGVVGYNVQTAVDVQHHLIVAHEATNVGNDRGQLASMAKQARSAMPYPTLSRPRNIAP